MDKKYSTFMIILTLIGSAIAGVILYQHYSPGIGAGFVLCGSDSAGCDDFISGKYSTLYGFPLASLGLFLYLVLLFTALVADYGGGPYYQTGFLLMAPLIMVSVAVDIALAAMMIWLQTVCLLCLMTYGVNLALLTVVILWYRSLRQHGFSLSSWRQLLIITDRDSPDKKVSAALYLLMVLLLGFAVFSSVYILGLRTAAAPDSKQQIAKGVATFYSQGREIDHTALPVSSLRIGAQRGKVEIAVFTDFLCSACYQFSKVERQIIARYGEQVSFSFYNYPLDQECNPDLQQTLYKSSCTAARAMVAASSLGFFPAYLESHFGQYSDLHNQYSLDKALDIAGPLTDRGVFAAAIGAGEVSSVITRDIELAKRFAVKATPTLFINGRRMEGVPSWEVMDAILKKELAGKGK